MPRKLPLQVNTEQEVIDDLKRLAKKDNRTLSNYIENVLKKHIEEASHGEKDE